MLLTALRYASIYAPMLLHYYYAQTYYAQNYYASRICQNLFTSLVDVYCSCLQQDSVTAPGGECDAYGVNPTTAFTGTMHLALYAIQQFIMGEDVCGQGQGWYKQLIRIMVQLFVGVLHPACRISADSRTQGFPGRLAKSLLHSIMSLQSLLPSA